MTGRKRRFRDAPDIDRCIARVPVRDGSDAQCGRRAKKGLVLCTQHRKMEALRVRRSSDWVKPGDRLELKFPRRKGGRAGTLIAYHPLNPDYIKVKRDGIKKIEVWGRALWRKVQTK